MARLALIACAATVIVASATSPASADPITIISGSVFIPAASPGDMNIVGTRGFSLMGRVAPGAAPNGGGSGLFAQCRDPECPPGTRIEFDVALVGGDALRGEMTIEGARYGIGSANSMANVFLQFDGSVIAPEIGPAQARLSAPFSLMGETFEFLPAGEITHELAGRGIGTVTLVPHPPQAGFAPSWTVDRVRFDIAQPTAEPSTLMLLGTCALGALGARRSRKSGVPPS